MLLQPLTKVVKGKPQIRFSSLAGRVSTALSNSNTPSTAMPSSLKGSRMSQKMGYRISASRARGQHSTKRMSQSNNFIVE